MATAPADQQTPQGTTQTGTGQPVQQQDTYSAVISNLFNLQTPAAKAAGTAPSNAVPTAIQGQPGTAGAKYYYGGSMIASAPSNKPAQTASSQAPDTQPAQTITSEPAPTAPVSNATILSRASPISPGSIYMGPLGGAGQGGGLVFSHQGEPEYSYYTQPFSGSVEEIFSGGKLQPSQEVFYYHEGKQIGYQAPLANVVMSGKPFFGVGKDWSQIYFKEGKAYYDIKTTITTTIPGPTQESASIKLAIPDTFTSITSALFKAPQIITIPEGSIITGIQGNPTVGFPIVGLQFSGLTSKDTYSAMTSALFKAPQFAKIPDKFDLGNLITPKNIGTGKDASPQITGTLLASIPQPSPIFTKGTPTAGIDFSISGMAEHGGPLYSTIQDYSPLLSLTSYLTPGTPKNIELGIMVGGIVSNVAGMGINALEKSHFTELGAYLATSIYDPKVMSARLSYESTLIKEITPGTTENIALGTRVYGGKSSVNQVMSNAAEALSGGTIGLIVGVPLGLYQTGVTPIKFVLNPVQTTSEMSHGLINFGVAVGTGQISISQASFVGGSVIAGMALPIIAREALTTADISHTRVYSESRGLLTATRDLGNEGLAYNIKLVTESYAEQTLDFMGKQKVIGTGSAHGVSDFVGIIKQEGNVEVLGFSGGFTMAGGKLLADLGIGALGKEINAPPTTITIYPESFLLENRAFIPSVKPLSFVEAYKAEESATRIADFSKFMTRTTEENIGFGMESIFGQGRPLTYTSAAGYISDIPTGNVIDTGGLRTPGLSFSLTGKAAAYSEFSLQKIAEVNAGKLPVGLEVLREYPEMIYSGNLPGTAYTFKSSILTSAGTKATGAGEIQILDVRGLYPEGSALGGGGLLKGFFDNQINPLSSEQMLLMQKSIVINPSSATTAGVAVNIASSQGSQFIGKTIGLTGIGAVGYNLLGIVPSEGKAATIPITETKTVSQVAFPKATYNVPTLSATMEKIAPQVSTTNITKTLTTGMTRTTDIARTSNLTRSANLTRTADITRTADLTRTMNITRNLDVTRTMDITRTMDLTRTAQVTRTMQQTPVFTPTFTPPPPPPHIIPPNFLGVYDTYGKVQRPRNIFTPFKKQTKYTPSIVASEFHITAPKIPKFADLSIVVRPVISGTRRSKRRKKR